MKHVLTELAVETTNFGQVRGALAERLCVVGIALAVWCQQFGDIVQGINMLLSGGGVATKEGLVLQKMMGVLLKRN